MEADGEEKSALRILERFAEKTSLVGAGYINSSTRKVAKIFWCMALLLAVTAMTLHLYWLLNEFLSWPLKTTLSLGFSNLKLPAVTICNSNVFRNSKSHLANQTLQNLLLKVNPETFDTNSPSSGSGSGSGSGMGGLDYFDNLNFANYSYDTDYTSNYYYNYYDYSGYSSDDDFIFTGTKDKWIEMQNLFQAYYISEPRSTRVEIGHQLENMLLRCSFGEYVCYKENFTLYQSADYGNCYTLDSDKFTVRKPGPKYGLQLILNLEIDEYLKGITDGYGARILIHNPKTIPFPDENGFFVQTNHETSIALKQISIERAEPPYGKCDESKEFVDMYQREYNRLSCQHLCPNTILLATCKCYDQDEAETLLSTNVQKKYKACKSKTERRCMAKVSVEVALKKKTCNCPEACSEKIYTKAISSRQWPTDAYAPVLKKQICNADKSDFICSLDDKDGSQIGRHFLKLKIFYEDLNFELITEGPDIENAQFASDFGGAIGLWIGLSMLSLIEVFQLIAELCRHAVRKLSETGQYQETRPKWTTQNNHSFEPHPDYDVADDDVQYANKNKPPSYHSNASYDNLWHTPFSKRPENFRDGNRYLHDYTPKECKNGNINQFNY